MAGVCRVIAGVSGSAGSLPALRYAAELAHGHDAALIPVVAWLSPAGGIADGSYPSPWLRQVWEDDAWRRLWDAFDAALGGIPSGVRVQPTVERGEAGRVLTAAASRADDLLVIGTGRRGAPGRLRHGKVSRYCLAQAHCPVLAVPPPALEQEAGHGLRGWGFRRRALSPGQITSPTGGR